MHPFKPNSFVTSSQVTSTGAPQAHLPLSGIMPIKESPAHMPVSPHLGAP